MHESGGTMSQKIIGLEGVVGPEVYKKAGLKKLSSEEKRVLKNWIEFYVQSIAQSVQEDCEKSSKAAK
jgi:hypothetical protein